MNEFLMKSSLLMKEEFFSLIILFSAMFNLHMKGKENVEKIEDLITHSASVIEEQKKHYAELRKLTSEKYLIQRKIDSIIEKLY